MKNRNDAPDRFTIDACNAGDTPHPFLKPDGDALATDLRTLQADLPRHAVMLSSFQQALAELDGHEARIVEATVITRVLDDYRTWITRGIRERDGRAPVDGCSGVRADLLGYTVRSAGLLLLAAARWGTVVSGLCGTVRRSFFRVASRCSM